VSRLLLAAREAETGEAEAAGSGHKILDGTGDERLVGVSQRGNTRSDVDRHTRDIVGQRNEPPTRTWTGSLSPAVKNAAVDKFDREIIEALWENARTSYKELGERVFLSPNAVSERIRRLEEAGVIQKYEVKVDLRALGLPLTAIIDVKLSPSTTALAFESALQSISGILEATLMTGSFDYMLRVACRDQEALVRLTEELRAGGHVQETYTRMPLRSVKLRSVLS